MTITPFADAADANRQRPASFTVARAVACTPTLVVNPEWQRRADAGDLPDGPEGCYGMLIEVPAREQLTLDEAVWVLRLHATGSMRWVSRIALADGNQVVGDLLVRAAAEVVATNEGQRT